MIPRAGRWPSRAIVLVPTPLTQTLVLTLPVTGFRSFDAVTAIASVANSESLEAAAARYG
ncbi:MAG: hypothetical protein ABJA98_15965 [Acidobacteriota bacterium]